MNGENVPEGTPIQVLINGQVFSVTSSEIYQGNSVYSLIVPGDDPSSEQVEGGRQGDVIYFKINGSQVKQTAIWESGSNTKLDLSISSDTTEPTHTPTTTPFHTQTIIPTRTNTPNSTKKWIPVVTTIEPTSAYTATPQLTEINTRTLEPILDGNLQDGGNVALSEVTATTDAIPLSHEQATEITKEHELGVMESGTLNDDNRLIQNTFEDNSASESEGFGRSFPWWYIVIPALILLAFGGVRIFQKRSGSGNQLL